MAKRVGILTFIDTLNYGAELQAYALNRAISKLGYESEIINYTCQAVHQRETPRRPKISDLKTPKRFLGLALKYPKLRRRAHSFKRFSETHTPRGQFVSGEDDIIRDYDTVVVGSDQVWCASVTNADPMFLLPNRAASKPRVISYAASFGDEVVPVHSRGLYAQALRSFDRLSIREKQGLEILKELGVKQQAEINVDPTMLLDAAEWTELSARPLIDGKYLFVYMVTKREETMAFAKQAAERLGLDIAYIDAYGGRPYYGARNMGSASPDEFVSLVKHAAYVVTSSFHGMCFAILFNKQFRFVAAENEGHSRLFNLANEIGLSRCCSSNDSLTESIEYAMVNSRIGSMRDQALRYLKNHISI
mgnify:CR=1 FL=1